MLDVDTGETIREMVLPEEVPLENRNGLTLASTRTSSLAEPGLPITPTRKNLSLDDLDAKLSEIVKGTARRASTLLPAPGWSRLTDTRAKSFGSSIPNTASSTMELSPVTEKFFV